MSIKEQLNNLAKKFATGGISINDGPGFGRKITKQYKDNTNREIVEFEDGTRMYTDSNEYKKLYSEGLLYGESPEKETFPQESNANLEMDRFKRIESENPYSDFVKPYFNGISGTLARGFNQSEENLANTPDDLKQKYDQYVNRKWAQEIFQENPRNENEERGAYLNRVGSGLKPDILKNLYDYMPEREMETYWQQGEKGVAALTDLKGIPGLENFSNLEDYIQGSNHMSDYEKSNFLADLKENPNSSKRAMTALGTLAPLGILAEIVVAGGRDDYSVEDAGRGIQNNTPWQTKLAVDPLNLVGIGLASKLRAGSKFSEGLSAINKFDKESEFLNTAKKLDLSPSMGQTNEAPLGIFKNLFKKDPKITSPTLIPPNRITPELNKNISIEYSDMASPHRVSNMSYEDRVKNLTPEVRNNLRNLLYNAGDNKLTIKPSSNNILIHPENGVMLEGATPINSEFKGISKLEDYMSGTAQEGAPRVIDENAESFINFHGNKYQNHALSPKNDIHFKSRSDYSSTQKSPITVAEDNRLKAQSIKDYTNNYITDVESTLGDYKKLSKIFNYSDTPRNTSLPTSVPIENYINDLKKSITDSPNNVIAQGLKESINDPIANSTLHQLNADRAIDITPRTAYVSSNYDSKGFMFLGDSYSPRTIHHEMGHLGPQKLLNNGKTNKLDRELVDELKKTDISKDHYILREYGQGQYMEPSAYFSEVKGEMMDKGFIKSRADDISPEIYEKYLKSEPKSELPSLIGKEPMTKLLNKYFTGAVGLGVAGVGASESYLKGGSIKNELNNLVQKYQVGGETPADWKQKYADNQYFKDREDWGDKLSNKFPNGKNTVKESIYNAAKQSGIDPGLLYTSSMEEGMKLALNNKDSFERRSGYNEYRKTNPKGAQEYPVDGGYFYGLNTFGDKYGVTIKPSSLPRGFKYAPYDQKDSDGKKLYTSAAFRSHDDAISAKAAMMKQVEGAMTARLTKNNLELSPDARKFFDMVGYNMGEDKTIEMIKSYQQKGYLKDDKFLDSKFQPASWKEPYTNVQRRYQNYKILNEQGYFDDYTKQDILGKSFQSGGEVNTLDSTKGWWERYVNSPKYRERLGKEFPKYSESEIDSELSARKLNLDRTYPIIGGEEFQDPGLQGFARPPEEDQRRYSSIKGKIKNFIEDNVAPSSRPVHLRSGEDTSTYTHEISHSVDEGGRRIPDSTVGNLVNRVRGVEPISIYKKDDDTLYYNHSENENTQRALSNMNNFYPLDEMDEQQSQIYPNIKWKLGDDPQEYSPKFGYRSNPTEMIARIQSLRKDMYDQGVHDSAKEDISAETLSEYINSIYQSQEEIPPHLLDLLNESKQGNDSSPKDTVIENLQWMMNNIAKNTKKEENQIQYSQKGGTIKGELDALLQKFQNGGQIGCIPCEQKATMQKGGRTVSQEWEDVTGTQDIEEVSILAPKSKKVRVQNEVIKGGNYDNDLPYSIIDKYDKKMYLFDEDGNYKEQSAVITGADKGDVDNAMSGSQWLSMDRNRGKNFNDYTTYLANTKQRITPSGIFTVEKNRKDVLDNPSTKWKYGLPAIEYGSKIIPFVGPIISDLAKNRQEEILQNRQKSYGDGRMLTLADEDGVESSKAIHTTGYADRNEKLNAGQGASMSAGCINIPGKGNSCFETLSDGSKVFILPENSNDPLKPQNKKETIIDYKSKVGPQIDKFMSIYRTISKQK